MKFATENSPSGITVRDDHHAPYDRCVMIRNRRGNIDMDKTGRPIFEERIIKSGKDACLLMLMAKVK